MRKPSPVFVGVITIASVLIGFLFLELRAERAAAAQLRERVAQLSGTVPSTTSLATGPGTASAALPSASSAGDAPQPANPLPIAARAIFSEAIRRELELTKEQGEEFVRLLRSNGSDADYVALIGGEKYEQYQEIQRAQSRAQRVGQLRTTLADTRHPLTDGQAAQLDQLLAAEQRRRAEDTKARPRPTEPRALLDYDETTLRATQAATERMIADARAFLSFEQAAMLESQLTGTLSQQEDNLRLRRAQLGVDGR
jgi:hypothetical protein